MGKGSKGRYGSLDNRDPCLAQEEEECLLHEAKRDLLPWVDDEELGAVATYRPKPTGGRGRLGGVWVVVSLLAVAGILGLASRVGNNNTHRNTKVRTRHRTRVIKQAVAVKDEGRLRSEWVESRLTNLNLPASVCIAGSGGVVYRESGGASVVRCGG